MHRPRALAAASATLLLLATAARRRQSLNPIERRVFRSICDAITTERRLPQQKQSPPATEGEAGSADALK